MFNDDLTTEHFSPDEMRCSCGKIGAHPENIKKLFARLEELRRLARSPIHITSGYRCPEDNANTDGAAKHSYHLIDGAADIYCDNLTPEELAQLARESGFKGLGIYPDRIHVDIRSNPYEWRGW